MTNQLRSFRPKFGSFVPGIGSVIDGVYWFDGVKVQVDLTVKMAPTATAPMGPNPLIFTPSEVTFPLANMQYGPCGSGGAHDGGLGKIHNVEVTFNDAASVALWWATIPLASITASAPFTWNGYSHLRVHYSYFPKNAVAPKNFAAYGDSITRFEKNTSTDTSSWANKVPVEGLTFAGGCAIDGGTSIAVLAGAKAISADAAVCMVGVNDIAQGVPLATMLSKVEALALKVGADNFILCKIPPYDLNVPAITAMNAAYELLAVANGWTLIDPFGAYRAVDGKWVAGASFDGTHPYDAPQAAAASIIRTAILAL